MNDTDLEGVIQNLPFKWGVQGVIFIVASLAYMFDACGVLLPTYLIPMLKKSTWNLDFAQLGWLGSVILIGMAIGAVVWSSLDGLFGRRKAFLATIADYSIFACLSPLAPSYNWLLCIFFFVGLGLGGCIPLAYAVVAEFMTARTRGMFLTAVNLFWPIGATLNGFIALSLIHYGDWRLIPICMGVPAFILFCIAIFIIPESPAFLVRRGERAKAYEIVNNLARRTGGGQVDITQAVELDTSAKVATGLFDLKFFMTHLVDLWRWNWLKTSAVWFATIATLLLYFSVLTWLPGILVKSGYSLYRADLFSTSVTAIGILANFLAIWIAEAIGRKWIIIVGATIAGAAIVLFTIYIPVPEIAHWWLLLFGFMNSMVIPVLWGYVSEVYPNHLRAVGFGWTSAVSRAIAGCIPVLFGVWLWPTLGLTGTFSLVLGLIIVAMVWFLFVAPETRKVSLPR